jgi:uncharacterized protein YecE (DUF72 family)
MDFGRDKATDLNSIDFSLPDGDDSILPGTPNPNFKFYLGAPKHGRDEWKGNLFPKDIKDKERLTEYAKHFSYLELNASFYKIPDPSQGTHWAEQVAADPRFRFSPKVSRPISHLKRFKKVEEETNQYLTFCDSLGTSLGPSFIQMSDASGFNNFNTVEEYLISLPESFQVNVEMRHPSFFEAGNFTRVTDSFKELNVGLIITDTNLRRDVLHMHLTTTNAQIRFNGNDGHSSDRFRLEQWRDRIQQWKSKGIKDVYFALHQPDDTKFHETVALAKEVFKDLLI